MRFCETELANAQCGHRVVAMLSTLVMSVASTAAGEDWPTYRMDSQRSAVTGESLAFPRSVAWIHRPTHEPRKAWPRNFRENPWTKTKIRTVLKFDHAFQPVVANGAVYFGSSADHKVYCLDGETGKPRWEFFTEGPIRCAPTLEKQRVYVGSDDGMLYCLDAVSGKLHWKVIVGPSDERLPGNEQLISRWPLRSGAALVDGVAYTACGLFPHREGCYLAAIDADSGKKLWTKPVDQVTQGYLLASRSILCVPAGKMPPRIYHRESGEMLASVSSPGGTFALISDDVLFAGPGLSAGEVGAVTTSQSKERLASFPGNELVVTPKSLFLLTDDHLRAVSRVPVLQEQLDNLRKEIEASLEADPAETPSATLKRQLEDVEQQIKDLQSDQPTAWDRECDRSNTMILADDTLIVGGDGEVLAIGADSGETRWRGEFEGRAMGLVAANGMLLVSTDRGDIYCFAADTADGPGPSPAVERDALQPASESPEAARAARVLSAPASKKGYCLLLGSEEAALAAAIANDSELTVVYVESDTTRATAVRRDLDAKQLYGPRVVVHQTDDVKLPYPKYLFNRIVIDASQGLHKLPAPEEVGRLLRPFGAAVVFLPPDAGTARNAATVDAWVSNTGLEDASETGDEAQACLVLRRGKLEGSGEWTHQYGDAGNATCSDDRLIERSLRLQWFGRPGPYRMFDRHAYTASPVYCHGRLFTLGEKILYGNDAYNGTVLWSLELPDLEPRVNLPRDCGFMAADEATVYLAVDDTCLRIDAETGRPLRGCTLPPTENQFSYKWGYVAIENELLFGSGVRAGAFYGDGRGPWYDDSRMTQPEYSLKVLSDYLFAQPKDGDAAIWRYDGVIINSTITLGGGRIYFIENRDPRVLANESRRLAGGEEWMKLVLVALDAASGETLWEEPLNYAQRTPVFFVGYRDDTLIVLRSPGDSQVNAFDATSGKHLWEQRHGWEQDHHGGHRRHPVLFHDVVYQQPHAYDLKTGEKKWSTNRFGGNCGTISACSSMMFSRLNNYPGVIDLADEARTENLVEVTRPGCWINILPAGGMVLVPEAGSGCSCAYPMHASMGFLSE